MNRGFHKLIFSFIFLSLFSLSLYGQGRRAVSGILLDNEAVPLIQASVQLLSPKDSSLVEGVVTNGKGEYRLWAFPGNYILKSSYIGFVPRCQNIHISVSTKELNVGTMRLSPDQIWLDGAVVSAKAQAVVVKEDTVVYNAAAYRVEEGAMVDELIAKIPGVQVDERGNVTLHGRAIMELYVNGRRFFGNNVKSGLKNLPADMIENIKAYEVPTEMSKISGVDDGDALPVLDLTIRKDKMNDWRATTHAAGGLATDMSARYRLKANMTKIDKKSQITIMANADNINGFSSLSNTSRHTVGAGSQGMTHARELGVNLSSEDKNLKWAANLHYGGENQDARGRTRGETIHFTGNSFSQSQNSVFTHPDALNFNGTLEWRPNSKTRLWVNPIFSYKYTEKNNFSAAQNFSVADSSHINTQDTRGLNYTGAMNADVAVSFSRSLAKRGRSASLYVRARYYDSDVENFSANRIRYYKIKSNPDSLLLRNQHYSEYTGTFYSILQLSYNEPITKNIHLQFVLRQDLTSSSRNRDFRHLSAHTFGWENQEFPSIDPLLSSQGKLLHLASHFQANFRLLYKKCRYSLGVICKPQYMKLQYHEAGALKTQDNKVFNISPNININYTPSKTEKLNFIYSSWAGAPSLYRLVPVASGTNPLYVHRGNPLLKPTFTHRATLNYNYSAPKRQNSLVTSLQWRMVQNAIVASTVYDAESGARTTTPQNIDGNWNVVGSVLYNETFSNSPFSLSANLAGEYKNEISLLYNNAKREDVINTIHRLMLKASLDATYRNDDLELGLGLDANFTDETSLLRPEMSRQPYCITPTFSALYIFPFKLRISTDFNLIFQRGFRYADLDRNYYLWNLSLSYPVLRGKGNLRLQAYDILNQLPDIVGSFGATSRSISIYQSSNSYILLSFIYRFSL